MNQRNIFKLLSLAGVVLGGIGTLLSGWADNKEQEAIIEEKVNEALAARNEEEESYLTRIVEPILSAIVDEIKRKFLTKTARSQKQSILFFRDPFKLVPVDKIAEMTDKFTRNEVMTSNEIRQKIGMKPSSDPKADELRNSNLSAPAESTPASTPKEDNNQNGEET